MTAVPHVKFNVDSVIVPTFERLNSCGPLAGLKSRCASKGRQGKKPNHDPTQSAPPLQDTEQMKSALGLSHQTLVFAKASRRTGPRHAECL
jgi:hypothetical protein